MPTLQFKTPSAIVQDAVAAAQAASSRLLDLRIGSALRAVFEADSLISHWLQDQILRVLRATRLATSSGDDATSFVADFGLTRLPASRSGGLVTFERFASLGSVTVPIGTLVRTSDLSQAFEVVSDADHSLWSASAAGGTGGYVLPSGFASATLPVRAVAGGAVGNVLSGSVQVISGALPGIDTVTNEDPFTGGADEESDSALKARFPLYIASLSKATRAAIEAAIRGVQQGLIYSLAENRATDGTWRPGHFVVVLDDGSGDPSDELIAEVYAAVDAVRAFTVDFAVVPPAVTTADVALTIAVGPGVSKPALLVPVRDAVAAYIGSLAIGQSLPVSRIAAVAYAVDPGITNVSAVTVNGDTDDITVGVSGRVVAGTITVG